MSSFADDFRTYILDNQLENKMKVYVNYTPSKEDSLTITTTGGYGSDISLDTLTIIEQPTIQVKCTHTNSVTADNTLRAIKEFIITKTNIHIGEYVYTLFSTQGDVLYISRDEDNRSNFVLNIRTLRTRNSQ